MISDVDRAGVLADPHAAPPRGDVLTVHLDGHAVVVWHGPGEDDLDRLALHDGRLRTWPTPEACAADAADAGWRGLDDDAVARSVLDLAAAQDWLRGRRSTLDPESALNLWNLADDVARSTGRPWARRRGRVADGCYTKLLAANVPWLFDRTDYRPRWQPAELRCLRRVLDDAVHLLRTTLT